MVIDAVMERFYGRRFDKDGRTAAKGEVLETILGEVLRARFFSCKPPKTAGREEFGREFVAEFLRRCRGSQKADIVATATALTARSIALAIRRFVLGGNTMAGGTPALRGKQKAEETPALRARQKAGETPALRGKRKAGGTPAVPWGEVIVSGGGAKNLTLMRMLETELSPLGLHLRTSDEFGIPGEAKEAVAFALLAFQTWHHHPSNIPSATGATRPAILGKISYV
jgi:anhydro-N-acetylmuramic acid kinase